MMTVEEFLKELKANREKELLFSYDGRNFVGANYHLTEVKNVQFDTTDCGGKTNHWKETHMQIWENPEEAGKKKYMTVDKIISILDRVDGINPLLRETELKFEYGNEKFPTSVMPVGSLAVSEDRLLVYLATEMTLCKASDACGLKEAPEVIEEKCCQGTACC